MLPRFKRVTGVARTVYIHIDLVFAVAEVIADRRPNKLCLRDTEYVVTIIDQAQADPCLHGK
jgi:hypothetical protein